MSTIPLAINTLTNYQQGQQGPAQLQALINQTKLQQQAQQQNQLNQQIGEQQLQQQQIATQQAQQQQQDIQKFNQLFQQNGGDWDKTVGAAQTGGVSPLFLQQAQLNRLNVLSKLQGYSEEQLTLANNQADALGKAALTVKDADPADRAQIAAQQVNALKLAGINVPDSFGTDDTSLDGYIAHSKATQDLIQESLANKKSAQEEPAIQSAETVKQMQNVAQQLANTQGDASWQSVLANASKQGISNDVISQFPQHWSLDNAKQAAQMSLSPEARAKLPVDNLELGSYLQQNPGKTPADFMAYKANQTATANATAQIGAMRALGMGGPAAPGTPGGQGGPPLTNAQKLGQKVGLTPDALDQAAQAYLQTGQIQSTGSRGIAGMAQSTAIRNRAAELDPNASLMANKGVYQANADSLKNLQKSYDQVTAFESTALKNLDQVAQAGQAVPDLSSRFANIPVRMISGSMLGTPEMARFRTALLTAQTEAAKVLSSANATGVLSDQARKEAEDVLDGNLPFPAMMASINQLKTDFGNREQSYQGQIADIQNRLRAAPQQNAPSGGRTAKIGGQTVNIGSDGTFDLNGYKYKVNSDGKGATLVQ